MCKGNKSTTSNTTTTSAPDPRAMQLYNEIMTRAQGVANTPYEGYTGNLVAPINQQQQAGIAGINAAQSAYPWAINAAMQAGSPLSPQDIQKWQDPYTQAVVAATQSQFNNTNQQQLNDLRGRAAAQNALGGNAQGIAEASLANQQLLAQSPVIANLYSQAYQNSTNTALADRSNQMQGAYGVANMGNAALQGANAQIGAGNLLQQNEQAQLSSDYNQWLNEKAYPFQTTQWLAGIGTGVGSQMGGTSNSQGVSTQPSPSPFSQVFGGLAGMGGMLGASGAFGAGGWLPAMFAMSDERVKENVVPIGRLNDGQIVYRYNFKGDPETHIGLLAQEVEGEVPEAVGVADNGLKMVDYDRATEGAIEGRAMGGQAPVGVAGVPYSGGSGFIPTVELTRGQGAPRPVSPSMPSGVGQDGATPDQMKNIAGLAKGIRGMFTENSFGDPLVSDADSSMGGAGGSASDNNPSPYQRGGAVGVAGHDDGAYEDARNILAGRLRRRAAEDGELTAMGRDQRDATDDAWRSGDYAPNGFGGYRYQPWSPQRGFADGGAVDDGFATHEGVMPLAMKSPQGTPVYDWVAEGDRTPHDIAADRTRRSVRSPRNPGLMTLIPEAMGMAPAVWGTVLGDLYGKAVGKGYAEGGAVDDFATRFGAADQAIEEGVFDPQGANYYNPTAPRAVQTTSYKRPQEESPWDSVEPAGAEGVALRSQPSRPRAAIAYQEDDAPDDYPTEASSQSRRQPVGVAPRSNPGVDWSSNSKLWPALIAAGFGMMASRSPYPGIAIGEGGLAGAQTYENLRQNELNRAMSQQRIDMEAKRLSQQADQFEKRHKLDQEKFQFTTMAPTLLGQDNYGRNIYAVRDPKTKGFRVFDPSTGKLGDEIPMVPGTSVPSPGALNRVLPPPGREDGDGTKYPAPPTRRASEEEKLPQGAQLVSANLGRMTDPAVGIFNDEAIANEPPRIANQVRAIARGLEKPPSLERKNPYNQRLMELVREYSPDFDATMYARRQRTANEYSVGVASRNLNAAKTLAGHLEELYNASNKLDNSRVPLWNKGLQAVERGTGVTGSDRQSAIKEYETAAKAVADETAKVFAGQSSALADREEWEKLFNVADSKTAQMAAIRKVVNLVDSRLHAMADTYNQGMSTRHGAWDLVDEKSKNIFERMRKAGEEKEESKSKPSGGKRPTLEEYKAAAKKANPNATDEQIAERYKKRYPD